MAHSVLKYTILTLMSLSFWSLAMAQSTGLGTINDPPYIRNHDCAHENNIRIFLLPDPLKNECHNLHMNMRICDTHFGTDGVHTISSI